MQKLLNELERDIRNQALIDNILRLNRRQKLMVLAKRFNHPLALGALFSIIFWVMFCMAVVHAEDRVLHASDVAAGTPEWKDNKVRCPTAEPCKIVILSAGEEKLLMQQNGILDTAAQARSLDLGQFAVYLKTRIANSPAGEPLKAAEAPKP